MHIKNGRVSAPLLILLLVAAYFFFSSRHGDDPRERTTFLGTWTDETGPPGNYVRFFQIARSIPGSLPGVEALDGHALFHDQRGLGDVKATWNYESTKPLRLNVLFPNRATVTPVKNLDHDHILICIVDTAKVEVWTNADVFEGADVIRLTRVPE
jgi:hypothetical protein